MNGEVNTGYSFGEFELDVDRCLLLKRGDAVTLKPKTFELLCVLVENHGRIVSKNDLLDKVWENQFVEENNLTVHVAALRKAFGEKKNDHRFIVTVPGKGYRFVAEINEPSNGHVVVETHKFERIVVEEEIEEQTSENGFRSRPSLSGERTGSGFLKRKMSRAFTIGAILLFAGAAFWFYYPRASERNDSKTTAPTGGPQQSKSRVFPTAGGVPHRVAISPDGKSLAYVQRYKGLDSIWLGDLESNNSIQITDASTRLHEFLTYGPDGRSLYFTARDENNSTWTLMKLSIYGGPAKDLISGVHGAVTFSPDGRRLAFMRSDVVASQNLLIIADAETGEDERILLRLDSPQRFSSFSAAWSPDGHTIVAAVTGPDGKNCDIAAVAVADGSVSKVGYQVCRGLSNLAWLGDGSAIVLISTPEGSGNGQVLLVSYPAGEARRITSDTLNYSKYSVSVSIDDRLAVLQARSDPKIWLAENNDQANSRQILEGSRIRTEGMHGLDIAPDGKILYNVRTGDSGVVWEMHRDGTDQRQLTASQKGSGVEQISVTADNRFIVFESNRSGKSEIWRAGRDGGNLTQLTSGGGNSEPALSPDGGWVIYTASRDGRSTLWRTSIEGGEPTQLTSEITSWPSVSPDGKYIASAFGKVADGPDKRMAVFPSAGGKPVKIFNLATNGIMYNRLRWSPDSRSIIYKDLVQGLWRQDLEKERPEAIKGLEDIRIFHFAFSADGRFVYSGGIPMREIVILEDFRPAVH